MDFSCDGEKPVAGIALCDADRFLKGGDSLAETIGAAKARLSDLRFVERSFHIVERMHRVHGTHAALQLDRFSK
jgi:hypothetical protein